MAAASRKPNSVPGQARCRAGKVTTIPLVPALLTGSSNRPGGIGRAVLMAPPYLVLLRAGFSLPPTLRPARCALTAPFHPYSRCSRPRARQGAFGALTLFPVTGLAARCTWKDWPLPCSTATTPCSRPAAARAVCFLCHFPSGCPDRVLPGALPCGVRTFLSLAGRQAPVSARPWPGSGRLARCGRTVFKELRAASSGQIKKRHAFGQTPPNGFFGVLTPYSTPTRRFPG
jgi:hypothetical protein